MIMIRSNHGSFKNLDYVVDWLRSDLLRTEVFQAAVNLANILNAHGVHQARLDLHCFRLNGARVGSLIPQLRLRLEHGRLHSHDLLILFTMLNQLHHGVLGFWGRVIEE